MRPIRTLLVDDEPLARCNLQEVIAEDPDIEVIGACASGVAALTAIASLQPDLVFLDVHMPGMSGIEVARRIATETDPPIVAAEPPVVVFVTAHGEFALEAFDVHALDYVLKPFSDARFVQSLQRAKAAVRTRALGDLRARLLEFAGAANPPTPRYLQRLLIQESGRTRIVMIDEVDWIGGAKNYVELHTARGVFLLRQALDALEQAMNPQDFARIHRSTIVRVERILEVLTEPGGRRLVVLQDGTELKVSRSHTDALMTRLATE